MLSIQNIINIQNRLLKLQIKQDLYLLYIIKTKKSKNNNKYFNKQQKMSRCQHGEPISLFCINQTCNWRQAGGCEICFKKFHTHSHNIDTITIDKLEQLHKLFYVKPQIKVKSRILQQAVYNYFIIMKSQISTSIDAVSRNITNKLNYPYLCSEGQLNIFRKIKNKQYKKINKKELKNFYNFANTQNKDIIQLNQKKLYQQEILILNQTMKSINDSFLAYAKAVQKLDNNFNVERSFLTKIYEMTSSIQSQIGKIERLKSQQKIDKLSSKGNIKQTTQNSSSKGSQLQKTQVYQNILQNQLVTRKNSGRDRKISLDYGITGGIQLNKFRNAPVGQLGQTNFDQNQKQISERKKKLFDLINNPQQTSFQNTIQKSVQKQKISKSIQKNIPSNITSVEKTTQNSPLPKHDHQHLAQQKQIPSPIPQHQDQHKSTNSPQKIQKTDIQKQKQKDQIKQQINQNTDNNKLDPDKAQLFETLLNQGINLPQFIAHTILPRHDSKPKLYQDTHDVKQRKITIPVKKFMEEEQNSSPLLRRKRQKNKQNKQNQQNKQGKQNGQNMGQINLFGGKTQKDQIVQDTLAFQTPKKNKQQQKLLLKDKEADSLALLIQSLPLPAQKAIPLLQAAIKYAHNNLSAAQYLSYLYLQIQKPKQCLQICNKILQQLQDSPQANQLSIHINNNKAAALNMLGRYSQTIGLLQKCLSNTKRDIYYKNLGDAYFSIAIYEKAIFNYQKAIEMNKQMQQAYYNLAVCYYIQQHLYQAKLNIQKALKINPKNQQYLKLSRQILIKLAI